MYGYIYKTTNIINGKIYIGQKKSNVFLGNKYLGSGKYLRCAIKHYGTDNFIVEMLDSSSSAKNLDELEKLYIQKFNSTNKDIGYNIAFGAVGGDTYSNLSDEDKVARTSKYSKSRKSNVNTYIAIHRGADNKRIDIRDWERYEREGWERGRSADWEERLTNSHKGIKQSDAWIAKRVATGWTNKSPEEYAKMIEKHRISATKQMMNTPKDERIKRARNANKFKGKKCCFVTNGIESHFVYADEAQQYLDNGYTFGMKVQGYTPPNQGKVYVTSGHENLQILPSELQSYLDRGYRRGLTRRNKLQ